MDVQKGRSKVVKLVPDSPMMSPTATIYGLDGAALSTVLVATPSAVSTAVVADDANAREVFEVGSVAGIVGALHVLVTDAQFGTAVGVVSSVDSVTKLVTLVDPLPAEPAVGATVVGLDVSVEIPTSVTAELAKGYILEVAEDGVDSVRLEFNVVRFPFVGPCKAHHVREKLAKGYPSQLSADEVLHQRVADEVNRQIRARLLKSARYVSAYWNPDTLAPVRAPMLTLVLAEQYGMREAGSSREEFLSGTRLEVRDRIGDVLNSIQPIDANMDGEVDADEQKGEIGAAWVR